MTEKKPKNPRVLYRQVVSQVCDEVNSQTSGEYKEKDIEHILSVFWDTVTQHLVEGKDVKIKKFGRFTVVEHKGRTLTKTFYDKPCHYEVPPTKNLKIRDFEKLKRRLNSESV